MMFTDDPIADFHRYDAEQEAALELLPECEECDEKIQTEYCFVINDTVICENCINHFKKLTTDLMG